MVTYNLTVTSDQIAVSGEVYYYDPTAIVGTNGDDTLYGDQRTATYGGIPDHIYGLDGNDRLYGLTGDDWLEGGAGNDYLDGGGDFYLGDTASYAYTLGYGIHASLVDGISWAINTTVVDRDVLVHIENLSGSYYNDVLEGNDGYNELSGLFGDDVLYGNGGSDRLDGGFGNDWLFGGDGNDVLIGDLGNDYIIGEAGTDTVSYAYSAEAMDVNLYTGSAHATADANRDVDILANIENITGTAFDDNLNGDYNANSISGGDGADVIVGWGGNDRLNGGNGNDFISGGFGNSVMDGGAGDDTIGAGITGNDTIYGGAGDDIIISSHNGSTAVVHGGAGEDTLVLYCINGPDYINLAAGIANAPGQIVTFDGIENATGDSYGDEIAGSAVANHLIGNGGPDMIFGYDGNDWLEGDSGNDHLLGGAGNDLISGGTGADELNGGTGFDTASYANASVAVAVDLAAGTGSAGDALGDTLISIEAVDGSPYDDAISGFNDPLKSDTLSGGSGNDNLVGRAAVDTLYGGPGSDVLSGGDGNDRLFGGDDNDSLGGGNGADQLSGDNGDDVLSGGAGNDVLVGGAGRDILTGGLGNDTFRFYSLAEMGVGSARDLIQDLVQSADHIDLHMVDAKVLVFGNQDFTFIGNQGFTPSDALHPHASAGQLHYFFSGTSTIIEGDVNGDAVADFQIAVNGNINFAASDFVL
jgi:Ca2+-binding RTX toxin-like protein